MKLQQEYLLRRLNVVKPRPSRILRYGVALISILLVISLKLLLNERFEGAPYLFAFLATLISAWYGGLGPGLIATFSMIILVQLLFMPPGDAVPHTRAAVAQVISFAFQGSLFSLICELGKQSNRALRRNTILYETLFQAQSDIGEGVILLEDERIVFLNDAACSITGLNKKDVTSLHSFLDRLSPEQRKKSERLLTGEHIDEQFTLELEQEDGDSLTLEVAAKTTIVNKKRHLVILLRNTTERAVFEESLRRSEEHYRLLVENVSDYAIFTLKKNGEIASWNEAAERIIGYEESEILGRHFSIVFSPPSIKSGLPEKQLRIAEAEGRAAEESWHVRKDGSLFFASGVVTPLWNEAGKLRGYIKVIQDITEHKKSEEQIRHQALHDGLTDLPNRTLFCDRVSQAIASSERHQSMLAVIFMDLDKFKNINDTLGHGVGDLLLQEIGRRVQGAVRKEDTVARLGGDEFTILLPQIKSISDCTKIVKKVYKAIRPAIIVEGHELSIGTSMGIAIYPQDGEDVQTLLKNADTALYQAKGMGRNTHQFYSSAMHLKANEKIALENDLRQALDRGEFLLEYQPIIDTTTKKMHSVEALVRWKHPTIGIVGPSEFIPIAEDTGIIVALNEWILRSACKQTKNWQLDGLPDIKISVNISARQFSQKKLVEKVTGILEETSLLPSALELEVTESFAMSNINLTTMRLQELNTMGISIAIDDFGTGHSSLNYLKHLPINTLKIDRSFVKGCTKDRHDAEIIKAIITIAHSLDLKVIAEGVETSDQLQYVTSLGCDFVQGFLFSQPVGSEQISAYAHTLFDIPE